MPRSPWSRRGMDRPTISVCIPARNEEATIGALVAELATQRVEVGGFIDELIVMDHESTDRTADAARTSGARVVAANHVASEWGPAQGKGDVLWRSLLVSRGDIVVWLDADLESLPGQCVERLAQPLIDHPEVVLVKGAFLRSLGGRPGEGGRVTEIAAKPALRLLAPELAHIAQPLSGQCALRRTAAEHLVFEIDYGVEVGMLLDLAYEHGAQSIREVNLGAIEHRHRSLRELSRQSEQVLRAILSRMGHRHLQSRTAGRPPVASLRTSVA
jgi:glucosyl-3-phosphoglycerate synthase